MKKIDGDVIAAIIFMLSLFVICVAILVVFWVKVSPILAISIIVLFIFLIINCK